MRPCLAACVCAALTLATAGPASATDHPVGPWPSCCSGPSYSDVTAEAGDTVTISGDFVHHPLAWTYGDFTTESAGPSRTYAFGAAGTYPFHCTIHSYMHGQVRVGSDQHATPDLSVSATSATTADAITFTYTGTPDPDGTIATYEWDYDGDGATDEVTSVDHAAHTYTTAGTYQPTVRVRDNGHELSGPAPAKSVAVTDATSQEGAGSNTGGSTGNTVPGGAGSQDGSGDPGTGTPATSPAADTTAPTAAGIRVVARRLRFTLGEDAALRGTLRRGRRLVRRLAFALQAGAVSHRLARHLAAGRYTLRFVLTDASGNRSVSHVVVFRVR